jgi:uncharacterized damage-inducible protein DinB
MRKILIFGLLAIGAANTWAQKTPVSAANETMLTMFEQQFMAAAKAMPADKYDFTPESLAISGAKYEKVRTFAGEVKHVAQANYFFYGAVSGMKPTVDVKGIGALKTKDEIVSALAASFAFGHQALTKLTAENEEDPLDIDGLKTKGTVAAFAVAHGFDHYGQMVEYLRMNGIVPPASAK